MKKLFSLLSFFYLLHPAFSQWSNNPDTNTLVISRDSARPFTEGRSVADNEGGTVFFALAGRLGADSVHAVVARKIRKDGFVEWGSETNPVLIMADSFYFHSLDIIDAASDGNNGAYVLFTVNRADSEIVINKAVLQHIGANGQLLWGDSGITVATKTDSLIIDNLNLSTTGSGDAIVSWEKYAYGDFLYTYSHVFVQKYSVSGQALWNAGGVNVTADGFQMGSSLVPDADGGAILCYTDTRDFISSYVHVQRIGSTGNKMWGDGMPVTTALPYQGAIGNSSIREVAAADGSGGVILAYESFVNQPDQYPEIRLQRLDANGVKLWSDTGILLCSVDEPGRDVLDIISDGANGAAIATLELKPDSSKYCIYLYRVSANGNYLWAPGGISVASDASFLEMEYLIKDSSGNFIIPYVGDNMNYQFAIKASKISPAGAFLWGSFNDGVLVSTNKYMVYGNVSMNNSTGDDIVISWPGERWLAPPFFAFANKLNADGTLAASVFYYSVQDGNWNNPATWSGGIIPGADAVVIIRNQVTVTADASCYTLRVEPPHGNVIINPGIHLSVTH